MGAASMDHGDVILFDTLTNTAQKVTDGDEELKFECATNQAFMVKDDELMAFVYDCDEVREYIV